MKLYAQTTAFIALLAVRTTLSIAVAAPPCGLADLVIAPGDISGEFSLCNSITNGGEVRVVGAGATFRAGSVTLANGFSVASGAPFTVETGLFSPGGVIPAGDPSGLELAFNVSGLTQLVSRVSIRLEVTHPFAGDLTATLTSPGGVAHLVLLGRPGHRPAFAGGNAGHSSNFAGAYLFDDFAAGDLWATISGLGADDSIPATPLSPISPLLPAPRISGYLTSL